MEHDCGKRMAAAAPLVAEKREATGGRAKENAPLQTSSSFPPAGRLPSGNNTVGREDYGLSLSTSYVLLLPPPAPPTHSHTQAGGGGRERGEFLFLRASYVYVQTDVRSEGSLAYYCYDTSNMPGGTSAAAPLFPPPHVFASSGGRRRRVNERTENGRTQPRSGRKRKEERSPVFPKYRCLLQPDPPLFPPSHVRGGKGPSSLPHCWCSIIESEKELFRSPKKGKFVGDLNARGEMDKMR